MSNYQFASSTSSNLVCLMNLLELSKSLIPSIELAYKEIISAIERGNKILTAGNGGSAADALHLAEELVGKYDKIRRGLPCVCLSADSTLLTCIANDFGFQYIFARQIQALGSDGDILIVFSTSGNSENIILAIEESRKMGVKTIALLGRNGGKAKGKSDIEIIVSDSNTARIQEIHTFILHSWLDGLEAVIK